MTILSILTLHLNVFLILLTMFGAMPTHLEWKSDWQPTHSSSGKPLTPGQYGVHGVTAAFCSPMLWGKQIV